MSFNDLRSVGGLEVASGWLTLLFFFQYYFIASGWFIRFYLSGVRVGLSRLFNVRFFIDFCHSFVCVFVFLRLFCRCFQLCGRTFAVRAAVPQGDDVLFSLADSLPDVALANRAPSTSSKYSSTYNR